MEFVPLKKHSAENKRKKSLTKPTNKLRASISKKLKKSSDDEVENSFSSQSDDGIDLEKESVVERLSNQISESVEKISEVETNQKIQIPRLFVNMKRVILNEEMVKEIHPDIIAIRYPRKKRSRWCWAIFPNEKKAEKALTQLRKRKDIVVTKPKEKSIASVKKKIKSTESHLKKSMKSKLKEAWL